MTAFDPNATEAEAVTWLTENVSTPILAQLVVACLTPNTDVRNTNVAKVVTAWMVEDPDAWEKFSWWVAHRAGLM